eukprot:CAMPEP_0172666238 /NCGR_PEP_ID=MMETSP1074-20121228/7690_1 /TAXON_ID=2916 /ORGANISM="Ceratium fusus, Strain PA161109" /LENGTH=381 /DNA_ID=CAMNT_0013482603 /DNA_START=1 /DNA_END=1146 /DNA_ORIENTATION=+
MQPQVELVFGTGNGERETKIFTHKPLGIQLGSKMPIVIKRLRLGSQAQQLGVKLGWQVHSINGTPLANMSFSEAITTLIESSASLRCFMLVRDPPLDAQSVARLRTKLGSTEAAAVVPVLQQYGFMAKHSKSWGTSGELPQLHLGMVDGHREISNPMHHTWYSIMGKLIVGRESPTRRWIVERRLAHVRALLYEPVKRELGIKYGHFFGKTPFAHHGRPPGTTARMASWLAALSKTIYCKALSPTLVASILRFLEAPLLDEDAGQTFSEAGVLTVEAKNGEAMRLVDESTEGSESNGKAGPEVFEKEEEVEDKKEEKAEEDDEEEDEEVSKEEEEEEEVYEEDKEDAEDEENEQDEEDEEDGEETAAPRTMYLSSARPMYI